MTIMVENRTGISEEQRDRLLHQLQTGGRLTGDDRRNLIAYLRRWRVLKEPVDDDTQWNVGELQDALDKSIGVGKAKKALSGGQVVTHIDETESPWSYLDDRVLTGKPELIKAADRNRDTLIDEVDWMVASGQNAAIARLVAQAKKWNKERDDAGESR